MNTGKRSRMSEAGRRVRVCDDAVFLVFARRAAGQAAGRLFFGSFHWSAQKNERKKKNLFSFEMTGTVEDT